jgi:hypothetical protein
LLPQEQKRKKCGKKIYLIIQTCVFISLFLYSVSFINLLWLLLLTAIPSLCNRMEFLNNAAFEDNRGTQESWLSPLPGATKYVPFLDSQTQGSQVFTRSAAALSGAFPLIIPTRNGANPKQIAPSQRMPTGIGADPKQYVPPPPFATQNGSSPQQNTPAPHSSAATPAPGGQSPFSGIAQTPTPGGHTPFSGIQPPFPSSAPASAGVNSQLFNGYTQPGVERQVHIDYLLYSQSAIADLIKSSRPSSSIAKKDKKEWEKYSPVGDLRVLLVDLSVYNLEKFKLEDIANLCND